MKERILSQGRGESKAEFASRKECWNVSRLLLNSAHMAVIYCYYPVPHRVFRGRYIEGELSAVDSETWHFLLKEIFRDVACKVLSMCLALWKFSYFINKFNILFIN